MKNKKNKKPYYLGLDIGTDSVGYAVTDERYSLCRFKGESMWGSGLFDPANTCEERRAFRTARRRLDRRQQRIRLLQEFFAQAIATVDARFFVRLKESALYAEDRTDSKDNQSVFNDAAFKDADFHGKYPTIHHLIVELMKNPAPHDVRLVYLACAWLMAHRGHFLSEISLENVASLDDVTKIYDDLMDYMNGAAVTEDGETAEHSPMWTCDAESFGAILAKRANLSAKREALLEKLFGGKKPKSDDAPYNRYDAISLLCGSDTVKVSSLFGNDEYEDIGKISLGMDDEKLEGIIGQLGEDGELIRKLKALYDWAILKEVRSQGTTISEAKVAIYETHRKDLQALKRFLRKRGMKLFKKVFGTNDAENYTAYVYNHPETGKRATKEAFCAWLAKLMREVKPDAEELDFYNDMMARLELNAFLPKQVNGDNRVIPHQLYQVELRAILKNAAAYLPFLNEKDEYGTVAEKIESMFAFRVPYYVGPLADAKGAGGKFAWMVRRKEGVIRPWNFKELVDLDASENAFIRRMTNTCTYLPGEDVLPAESLLYREFTVLNELNPLKISGTPIPADVKARIIDELFKKRRNVSVRAICKFLEANGFMKKGEDALEGLDETFKSTLGAYHDFKGFLSTRKLTEDEVESIILRSTCTEDTSRFSHWLAQQSFAGRLESREIKQIARFKYSEFGRLSKRFLTGIAFACKRDGATGTVLSFMRERNVLLMELLSGEYTLRDELDSMAQAYYAAHPVSLEERLDQMYVSSAVKRQIYRALDIVKTITKVQGSAPGKVFVEMARGGTPDQKGKRTISRYEQVRELYRRIHGADAKCVNAELEKMGDGAHNRLQGDALFLWTLQMGKCAYCGKPLPIENLKSVANVDHIHPQSKVMDDSVTNNKVLCCSACNGKKGDAYPVPTELRQEDLWRHWHDCGLMTDEKYRRLTRREHLSEAELQGFINRQLVETRQTTKAVFALLQELLPETEIVAVKAGNVSEFRHAFKLVKCRSVNDLHHAKDAYLNIVVGNVYHERFSKQFFRLSEGYSMKVTTLFGEGSCIRNGHGTAWEGLRDMMRVKATMARNDIHLTKYAFYAKGGFFDQMPKGPGESTIPRKQGLSVAKYGGYAKPSAAGYLPVAFTCGKKRDIMIMPVDLLAKDRVTGKDEETARQMIQKAIEAIEGKSVTVTGFPIGRKLLKVNSILSLDGFQYVIRGKSGGGKMYLLSSFRSLILSADDESYVKRLERLSEKMKTNKNLVIDSTYDHVSSEANLRLYGTLAELAASPAFNKMPASQAQLLRDGRDAFCALDVKKQVGTLLNIVALLKTNRAGGCDLTGVGGVAKAGVITISSKLSNWKKSYTDARIVFSDFTGIYRAQTKNLLEDLM